MKKEALQKWHIAGIQALRSASEQGAEEATEAAKKFIDPQLKEVAKKVAKAMMENEKVLSGFLKQAGAKVDAFDDQIMKGVTKGTTLMVKAAEDGATNDLALMSGGMVAINYFIHSFRDQATTAAALGETEQVKLSNEMLATQQGLLDEYNTIREKTVNEPD